MILMSDNFDGNEVDKLQGFADDVDIGELRPLRQAGCGFRALLALQASILLQQGRVPARELEAPHTLR